MTVSRTRALELAREVQAGTSRSYVAAAITLAEFVLQSATPAELAMLDPLPGSRKLSPAGGTPVSLPPPAVEAPKPFSVSRAHASPVPSTPDPSGLSYSRAVAQAPTPLNDDRAIVPSDLKSVRDFAIPDSEPTLSSPVSSIPHPPDRAPAQVEDETQLNLTVDLDPAYCGTCEHDHCICPKPKYDPPSESGS